MKITDIEDKEVDFELPVPWEDDLRIVPPKVQNYCRQCGAEFPIGTSYNKMYCAKCLSERRKEQDTQAYQRVRYRKSKEQLSDEMRLSTTSHALRDEAKEVPPDIMKMYEAMLMNRCGIQYGKFSLWKQLYPAEYLKWREDVKELHNKRSHSDFLLVLPDGVPEGLERRKKPGEHEWAKP